MARLYIAAQCQARQSDPAPRAAGQSGAHDRHGPERSAGRSHTDGAVPTDATWWASFCAPTPAEWAEWLAASGV